MLFRSGATRFCIDETGVLYIDTGRARPSRDGAGEGCEERSLSWPLNLVAVRPERRAAVFPMVSSFMPSESSVVSAEVDMDTGDVDCGATEDSRELRPRSEDMMESPRATV